MLPRELVSRRDKISNFVKAKRLLVPRMPIDEQPIFAGHLVLQIGGFIEQSMQVMVNRYIDENGGSGGARRFIGRKIGRMNSLSSGKIKLILDDFDTSLYNAFSTEIGQQGVDALDSVKRARDNFAHGSEDKTTFLIAAGYFKDVRNFPEALHIALGTTPATP